jgi:hypothetical protein
MLGDKTAIKTKFNVRAFVLGGLWAIFMVGYTTFGRLHNEVDGVIMARQTRHCLVTCRLALTSRSAAGIWAIRLMASGETTFLSRFILVFPI